MTDKVGVVRPAHCTALGKILIAHLERSMLDRFISSSKLRRYTANTIVRREALLRELDEVCRTGIAIDDGEFDAEGRCVAAPVRDFTGRVMGAIGISGPIWRLSPSAVRVKSQRVRQAADSLSREFGYAEDRAKRASRSPNQRRSTNAGH